MRTNPLFPRVQELVCFSTGWRAAIDLDVTVYICVRLLFSRSANIKHNNNGTSLYRCHTRLYIFTCKDLKVRKKKQVSIVTELRSSAEAGRLSATRLSNGLTRGMPHFGDRLRKTCQTIPDGREYLQQEEKDNCLV